MRVRSTALNSSKRLSPTLSAALVLVVVSVPLVLFMDPLRTYRLHSDDFAYLGASRSLDRALENLYVPHNTHIVPVWRILTWAVMAIAGRLVGLQRVLAVVSYGALVLAMLLVGRIVSRETGRASAGLAAMIALGTTSLVKDAATWYSAGQTLWAGIGILATLAFAQDYRRAGGAWRLALAALSTWVAGGFWTIGHAAGAVGAVYLWADGRPHCRKAAAVPLGATAATVATALFLGGRQINGTVSFHGRTSEQAIDVLRGISHTFQAIAEDLAIGNLGLVVETTAFQAVAMGTLVFALWVRSTGQVRVATGARPRYLNRTFAFIYGVVAIAALIALIVLAKREMLSDRVVDVVAYCAFAVLTTMVFSPRGAPLERAGAVLVLASYLVEWSFRGYLPYSSLRGVVPWYATIPDIGAVLFVAGWCTRSSAVGPVARPEPVTWRVAAAVLVFELAFLVVHRPRVDALFTADVPEITDAEKELLPTADLQLMRARYLAGEIARWQRRHLARLDRAQAVARRIGIGREGIARAFGRLDMPELPKVYDAAPLLDLPWEGTENDPAVIRRALGPLFQMEPQPVFPLDELRTSVRAAR